MSFLPSTGAIRVNRLLAGLPPEDTNLLALFIRIERPAIGQVLSSRDEPSAEIWFPHSGIVSLTVTDNEGRSVQTGMVGQEGCVGLEALFGRVLALADAAVQIPGEMTVIQTTHLRSVLDTRPLIQGALLRFLYDLSAQSLQTIACNRLHSLEARCCRWLLMMQDKTGDDDLPLTQECLATILGSGRPRINALLAAMEAKGLVRRYRGRIRLLSRNGLTRGACECYRLLGGRP